MEKKIKGGFLIDFVRMMRNKKDADWSKHLTLGDLALLRRQIRVGEWYPFETFERLGLALVHELANDDLEIIRLWGRMSTEVLCQRYKNLAEGVGPNEAMIRFMVTRENFFNFDAVSLVVQFKNYARVKIAYGMNPLAEEAAVWQTLGYFERLLELSGANNVRHNFVSRAWTGAPATVMELNWSNVSPEMKVQGSLFLDYVRMLKSKKDVDWSECLLSRDMGFLAAEIKPEEWYPFETYERMGMAILAQIAENDMELVRLFGQTEVASLNKLYPQLVAKGDPRESLMRLHVLRRSFFSFEAMNIAAMHGNYAKIRIDWKMCRCAEEAACMQLLGILQGMLQMSGAGDIKASFSSKSWEGYPDTILEVNWK